MYVILRQEECAFSIKYTLTCNFRYYAYKLEYMSKI